MYALASKLQPLPIISLQTGETVGMTKGLLIDPASLELVALSTQASRRAEDRVLMVRDIREVALDCLIVDSEDELAEPGDIVRIQGLMAENFNLSGLNVVTDFGRKLGQIEDYTVNIETYRVQKIYVRQSLLRSLMGSSLIIDRAQIIDVAPRQIVVREAVQKAGGLAPEHVPDPHA